MSALHIDVCKIDELGRPAVEDRLHHEHAEVVGLVERRLGRHGKLLPGAHHVDQDRPLVCQRGLERGFQFLRFLDPAGAVGSVSRIQNLLAKLPAWSRSG
jgi:hypothetical protein